MHNPGEAGCVDPSAVSLRFSTLQALENGRVHTSGRVDSQASSAVDQSAVRSRQISGNSTTSSILRR